MAPKKKADAITPAELRKNATEILISNSCMMPANTIAALFENTVIDSASDTKGLSVGTAMRELKARTEEVKAGDLSGVEAILATQIQVLNQWFNRYMAIGIDNHGKVSLDRVMALYALAMKAQEQTRKTAATLAAMKQPKQTAFIKQQVNQANNQQVINGPLTQAGTSEKIPQEKPNELMDGGAVIESRLDSRTAAATIGNDTEVAALGTINRAKVARR